VVGGGKSKIGKRAAPRGLRKPFSNKILLLCKG